MSRLELCLPAEEVPALLRSRAVARQRNGPVRQRVCRKLWHDTADGALATQGLVLVEQRHAWRIERLFPNHEPWPPATPPPVLAEAPSRTELTDLPPGTMAIAAFQGRERTLGIGDAGETATLTLQEGVVSGVAREAPACRVVLEGEPEPVLVLARRLALAHGLTVPRCTLAAEAIALVREMPPPPHRTGMPEIRPGMSVGDATAHVVGWLVEVMLHYCDRIPTAKGPEPVHQMRVATRRLRSALGIFRGALEGPAIEEARRELRALAARLGPARDWDVFLAGTGAEIGARFADEKRVAALLQAGERQRDAAYVALRSWLTTPQWRELTISLAGLAALRPWHSVARAFAPAVTPDASLPTGSVANEIGAHEIGTLAAADDGLAEAPEQDCADFATAWLRRRHRRVLRFGAEFEALEPVAFHELRKQCKRLRYATEFFTPLLPDKQARRLVERIGALQDAMGLVNDTVVAEGLMQQLGRAGGAGWAGGVVAGYIAARTEGGRERAARAWERFAKLDVI